MNHPPARLGLALAISLLALPVLLPTASAAPATDAARCQMLIQAPDFEYHACTDPSRTTCPVYTVAVGPGGATEYCFGVLDADTLPLTAAPATALNECVDFPYGLDMGAGVCIDTNRRLCEVYTYTYGPNHYEERCYGLLKG